MEELSIEEKANRYDEAIKRIEDIKTGKCETTFMFSEGLFEHIFPEHVESKDEKIRKAIYNCVEWFGFDSSVFKDVSQEECLAWIYKQGEQKHAVDTKVIIPKFRVGDVIHLKDSCVEYTIKSISDDHYYGNGFSFNIVGCDRDYELVEHNPSWSEEDEKMLGKCIDAASGYYSSEDKPNMKDWLRAIKGRILPQPLHAWSEEDEKALDSMLNDIKQGAIPDNDDINWLKTFKERVQLQPQPKQEWSDEDEKARLTTEFVLMQAFGGGTPLVDWLRKLKDRATVLIN